MNRDQKNGDNIQEKKDEENNIYKIFHHYAKENPSEKEFSEDIKSSLQGFSEKEAQKIEKEKKENLREKNVLVLEVEKKKLPFWLEILINIAVIAILFTLVRIFIFMPFNIEGTSMEGTLHNGEFIYVDRATPYFRDYERGDVVVFTPPYTKIVQEKFLLCKYHSIKNFLFQEEKINPCMVQASFVKRIIGVEGDIIEIQDGLVYLTPKGGKKQEISQSFLSKENVDKTCLPAFNCQNKQNFEGKVYPPVPKGKYFVLGDNRRNSSDSRESSWDSPFVEAEKIVGIARGVFLSPQVLTLQEQVDLQKKNIFMRTFEHIKQVLKGFSNTRILHQQKIISE